ncbi:Retrovirus-related Pol polyprotein from transposon RE2-like protein [Drosera capensis]
MTFVCFLENRVVSGEEGEEVLCGMGCVVHDGYPEVGVLGGGCGWVFGGSCFGFGGRIEGGGEGDRGVGQAFACCDGVVAEGFVLLRFPDMFLENGGLNLLESALSDSRDCHRASKKFTKYLQYLAGKGGLGRNRFVGGMPRTILYDGILPELCNYCENPTESHFNFHAVTVMQICLQQVKASLLVELDDKAADFDPLPENMSSLSKIVGDILRMGPRCKGRYVPLASLTRRLGAKAILAMRFQSREDTEMAFPELSSLDVTLTIEEKVAVLVSLLEVCRFLALLEGDMDSCETSFDHRKNRVKGPAEWLALVLTHVDESLRVDAAETIFLNPKTSSLPSHLELHLMRKALPMHMRCSSTAFLMKWNSLFKTFFSRVHTALERQKKQGNWLPVSVHSSVKNCSVNACETNVEGEKNLSEACKNSFVHGALLTLRYTFEELDWNSDIDGSSIMKVRHALGILLELIKRITSLALWVVAADAWYLPEDADDGIDDDSLLLDLPSGTDESASTTEHKAKALDSVSDARSSEQIAMVGCWLAMKEKRESARRVLTGLEYFHRYPTLHSFIFSELKLATELLCSETSGSNLAGVVHPSLCPVLILLLRLKPSPIAGEAGDHLDPFLFMPFIMKILTQSNLCLRVLASRASTGLISNERLQETLVTVSSEKSEEATERVLPSFGHSHDKTSKRIPIDIGFGGVVEQLIRLMSDASYEVRLATFKWLLQFIKSSEVDDVGNNQSSRPAAEIIKWAETSIQMTMMELLSQETYHKCSHYILRIISAWNFLQNEKVSSPSNSTEDLSLAPLEYATQHVDPPTHRSTRMDVKNAFLNGDLSEEVYMKPSPGYDHPLNKVCRLRKALYGYAKFHSTLGQLGFTTSYYDSALFIKKFSADPTDRRSTTGYYFFLGSSLISWRCKEQSVVSRSSSESEYRSLTDTTVELVWLRWLLNDMSVSFSTSTPIHCDSESAIQITHNDVFHERTKHIEIDCHFVRHHFLHRTLSLSSVASVDQTVDLFTKTHPPRRFHALFVRLIKQLNASSELVNMRKATADSVVVSGLLGEAKLIASSVTNSLIPLGNSCGSCAFNYWRTRCLPPREAFPRCLEVFRKCILKQFRGWNLTSPSPEIDNYHEEKLLLCQICCSHLEKLQVSRMWAFDAFRRKLFLGFLKAWRSRFCQQFLSFAGAHAGVLSGAGWFGGIGNHKDAFMPVYTNLLAVYALSNCIFDGETGDASCFLFDVVEVDSCLLAKFGVGSNTNPNPKWPNVKPVTSFDEIQEKGPSRKAQVLEISPSLRKKNKPGRSHQHSSVKHKLGKREEFIG